MGHWRVNWWTRLYRWWKIMFLDMGRQRVRLAVVTVQGSPSEKKKRHGKRKTQRSRWIQKNRWCVPWWRTNTRQWLVVRRPPRKSVASEPLLPVSDPGAADSVWWSKGLRRRLVGKAVFFTFRQHFHVRPEWMCLKQVMCPSYSHFRKWKIWEWLLNWIRRETKLHVLLLACTLLQLNTLLWDISSWIWRVLRISHNRVSDPLTWRDMWHLPWQIKKSVNPVHSPGLDEDDDDKPVVRPDRAADSEDEDDQPLVQPSSRKEPVKEKRQSAPERRVPAQLLKWKEPPVWRDPTATREPAVSVNSRERSEEVSILGKKSRWWSSPQSHQ